MFKRLSNWRVIPIFVLVALTPLVWQILVILFGEDYSGTPAIFSVYPKSGYYEIDPETTLDTLSRGETNVFTPASPEILYRDEPTYDSIAWTQSDFMKIANALSLKTWNEPLDLKSWKVIYMSFLGGCENQTSGFHSFTIAYYKPLGIADFEKQYTTRLIDIISWQGLARWGNDAVFSTPVLLGWDGVDVSKFQVTADDALQIAENNGGLDVRRNVDNACRLILTVSQLDPLPHRANWLVDYDRADFYMHINPYNGKYKILDASQ